MPKKSTKKSTNNYSRAIARRGISSKYKRPSWDEYFIELSRAVGSRGTCDRARSGCVFVRDRQILTTGYVGSPKGFPHCDEVGHFFKKTIHEDGSISNHCVRTIHAEQNAICQAAKLGISLDKSTVYVKMEPCSVCAKMLVNVGVERVVCDYHYHAADETRDIFKKAKIKLLVVHKELPEYSKEEEKKC